jgi:hypothetical protein
VCGHDRRLTIGSICGALKAEGKKARKPRPYNQTPPYVTARPEITHRKIKGDDGEKLRFVIMATDGRECCLLSLHLEAFY